MSIAETVVEKVRALPPDKQEVVLEFVESLCSGTSRSAQARLSIDRIRCEVERQHGKVDVVLSLLREDRDR